MRRALIIFAIFISSVSAYAGESADSGEYANHEKFLGSGIRYGSGFGPTIYFSRRYNENILFGTSFFWGTLTETKEGGSLDTAQFYKDFYVQRTVMLELNSTFYFREHGYAKWGPFLRGGVGYAHSDVKGHWSRYDRDPAFIVVGDDKRLLESGPEVAKSWDSGFVRIGAYYQFLWGFKPTSPTGHILELGLGGTYYGATRSVAYTKPNGDYYSKDSESFTGVAEFNYIVAF